MSNKTFTSEEAKMKAMEILYPMNPKEAYLGERGIIVQNLLKETCSPVILEAMEMIGTMEGYCLMKELVANTQIYKLEQKGLTTSEAEEMAWEEMTNMDMEEISKFSTVTRMIETLKSTMERLNIEKIDF